MEDTYLAKWLTDFPTPCDAAEFCSILERKLQTGEDTFKFQDMVEDMAQQTGRTIESERFEDDLFKGQSKEFRLLFETVNKRKDLYRIRI
jgi:hypothetical protein